VLDFSNSSVRLVPCLHCKFISGWMEDVQAVYLCCSKLSKYKSFHDAVVEASHFRLP
jgi:hypothetical protein